MESTEKASTILGTTDDEPWPDTGIMKHMPVSLDFRKKARTLLHEIGLATRQRWIESIGNDDTPDSLRRIWEGSNAVHYGDALPDALLYAPELFENTYQFQARTDIRFFRAVYGVKP